MQLRWMDNLLCNTGVLCKQHDQDAGEMDPGDGLCRMVSQVTRRCVHHHQGERLEVQRKSRAVGNGLRADCGR